MENPSVKPKLRHEFDVHASTALHLNELHPHLPILAQKCKLLATLF